MAQIPKIRSSQFFPLPTSRNGPTGFTVRASGILLLAGNIRGFCAAMASRAELTLNSISTPKGMERRSRRL